MTVVHPEELGFVLVEFDLLRGTRSVNDFVYHDEGDAIQDAADLVTAARETQRPTSFAVYSLHHEWEAT